MKKKIALILSILMICCCFISCGKSKEDNSSASENPEIVVPPKDEVIVDGIRNVTFSNFDEWKPDYQLMSVMNKFGDVNINTDKKFVRSGNASCVLRPMGPINTEISPYVFFPLTSELFNFSYEDFTNVVGVKIYVYSPYDETQQVALGLVTNIVNVDNVDKTSEEFVDINKGWNEVKYAVDRNVLNLFTNVKEVKGIYLAFKNYGVRYEKDAPTFYIDDLILEYDDNMDTNIKDLLVLDENEICSFDKFYQHYIYQVECGIQKIRPTLNVVMASKYNLIAKSGESVLRMVTKGGEIENRDWPRVVFPASLIQKSTLATLPVEERDNYSFAFEIYNNSNADKYFFLEFFDANVSKLDIRVFKCKRGQWTSVKIPIKELHDIIKKNPGRVRLTYGEYIGPEQEFFIDSLRIEAN